MRYYTLGTFGHRDSSTSEKAQLSEEETPGGPGNLVPEPVGFPGLVTLLGQLMVHFQKLLASLALKIDGTNHRNASTTSCLV